MHEYEKLKLPENEAAQNELIAEYEEFKAGKEKPTHLFRRLVPAAAAPRWRP